MENNRLNQLKDEYWNIPIPEELDFVVKKALKEAKAKRIRKNRLKKIRIAVVSVVASVLILTVGVNSSPVFAKTLSDVPVIGSIVKVLIFREYKIDEETFQADIKVPTIRGLENKDLENSLNQKYMDENKKLYEQFISDMEELKKEGGGYFGVDSGYEIKTDNDAIFSICRYITSVAASSDTKLKYDTIDKKKQILITLPILFKDDSYVDIISKNIKAQMKEQIKSDEDKIYWVEGYVEEGFEEKFEKISKEQNFYINKDNKLVISFDKYEVAPGYMGVVEFIIPTEILSDILVGNEYIK